MTSTESVQYPEISVAPMMDWTDRHYRYFLRLISPNAKLYTEMVTANALIYGDKQKLLKYHAFEHPLAVQLAGSDPKDLAVCAKLAEQHGFVEINLNVGCPSDRVQQAKIGACLMAHPGLVADCIKAMQDQVSIPVTIKTRIGIDEQDSYEFLTDFVGKTSDLGCKHFIIHARKAWLTGLNPKQNRTIPELDYNRVYKLKQDFKDLTIILNGGIETLEHVTAVLPHVDGVMIGRAAYHDPYLFAELEQEIFKTPDILSRYDVIQKLLPYMLEQLQDGMPWIRFARHYLGLFKGQAGARLWRQFISETRSIDQHNLTANLNKITSYLKNQESKVLL